LGSSSRELPLEASVSLETQERLPLQYDNRNTLREWIDFPETKELVYPVIEAFFKSMPTEYQGDLKDYKIHNDFFLDIPMSKYPVLSAGMISMESIDEMVERSKSIRVKL
jgi:hypothetical protein